MKMHLKFIYKLSAFLAMTLLNLSLTSCSWFSSDQSQQEMTLNSLKKANSKIAENAANNKQGTIRQVALHEMALSVGMRGGLYARSKDLNEYLQARASSLDKIFSFNSLMLPNNIIPPVLVEAVKTMDATSESSLPKDDDTFLLNDNPTGQAIARTHLQVERVQNNFRTLRITDRVYKIVRQARFAVAVPGWRDYLQTTYTEPGLPESSILPKNSAEQETWSKGIEEGWYLGYKQAEQIFAQNLMLLRRDYLGMARYRKLLAADMVSAPYVARRDYGVTGNGDEIKINDKVLTIAALPSLKADSKSWKPFMTSALEAELDAKINNLKIYDIIKNADNRRNTKLSTNLNDSAKSLSLGVKDKSGNPMSANELYSK